jgi:hypothetical protein
MIALKLHSPLIASKTDKGCNKAVSEYDLLYISKSMIPKFK